MAINVASLAAAGISPSLARAFEAPLRAVCEANDINTPVRQAAFVAQCGHESLGFSDLEESMWYSRPEIIRVLWPTRVTSLAAAQALTGKPQELANTVYSGRYGNGDKLSGDGWKYIGRGLIQLTFSDNYVRCGRDLGRPYAAQPELLAKPEDACRSAGWFWRVNHCNALADTGSVEAVTRTISPQMTGLTDRKRRYAAALGCFT